MSLHEEVPDIPVSPAITDPFSVNQIVDHLRLLYYLLYFPRTLLEYVDSLEPLQFRPRAWIADLLFNLQEIWLQSAGDQIDVLKITANIFLAFLFLVYIPLTWLLGISFTIISFATQFIIGLAVFVGISAFAISLGSIRGMYTSNIMSIIGLIAAFIVSAEILYSAYVQTHEHITYFAGISGLFLGSTWGFLYSTMGISHIRRRHYWRVTLALSPNMAVVCIIVTLIAHRDFSILNVKSILTGASVGSLCYLFFATRPDAWILFVIIQKRSKQQILNWIPQVTPFRLPELRFHLENGLELDWQRGIHNANMVWRYTLQQALVSKALHNTLIDTPGDTLFANIAHFASHQREFDWFMFFPEEWGIHLLQSFRQVITRVLHLLKLSKSKLQHQSKITRKQQRQRAVDAEFLGENLGFQPILNPKDTKTWRAVVIGFYYLANGRAEPALTAFIQAPESVSKTEMHAIAQAFTRLWTSENLLNQSSIKLPHTPLNTKQREIWQALNILQDILRYSRLYYSCRSNDNRSIVQQIVQQKIAQLYTAPYSATVTSTMIYMLLTRWRQTLDQHTAPLKSPPKTSNNPFSFTDPLRTAQLLVGRERELEQIRKIWASDNIQPILVLGPPLTGKSSLVLVAASLPRIGVTVIWCNYRHVPSDEQPEQQLLSHLCLSFAQTFDIALSNEGNTITESYAHAERYIRTLCSHHNHRQTVIVFDDFDRYDHYFQSRYQYDRIINFFWTLYQTIPNLSFVFIGKTLPRLFQHDSRLPFGRIAHRIYLQNLSEEDNQHLLQRPPHEFFPQFLPSALDSIWDFTGGQPYLVQLLAHAIVQRYETGVARFTTRQLATPPDPVFNKHDVDIVTLQPLVRECTNNFFSSLSIILEDQIPYSTVILDILAPTRKLYQRHIAHAVIGAYSVDLNEDTVFERLKMLRQWGIIEHSKESTTSISLQQWSICSKLYQDWLREHRQA